MDATRSHLPAPPPAEHLSSEVCEDPQGGGVAPDLSGLTVRHLADELWLQLADDADASMGTAWYEQDPHVCRFTGCCDLTIAVRL
jgi:hypothetical protein